MGAGRKTNVNASIDQRLVGLHQFSERVFLNQQCNDCHSFTATIQLSELSEQPLGSQAQSQQNKPTK